MPKEREGEAAPVTNDCGPPSNTFSFKTQVVRAKCKCDVVYDRLTLTELKECILQGPCGKSFFDIAELE